MSVQKKNTCRHNQSFDLAGLCDSCELESLRARIAELEGNQDDDLIKQLKCRNKRVAELHGRIATAEQRVRELFEVVSRIYSLRMIKFRVRDPETKEIVGYEKQENGFWWHMFVGSIWQAGVFADKPHIREQWTGCKDDNGVEIYDGDTVLKTLRGESSETR